MAGTPRPSRAACGSGTRTTPGRARWSSTCRRATWGTELSDAPTLRRAGWEEQGDGNGNIWLWVRAGGGVVSCHYERGVLVGVGVSAQPGPGDLPGAGRGPVALSVFGTRLSLPATDEAITAALGQPLRRE